MIKKKILLNGCGNHELLLRNEDWKYEDTRLAVFMCFDDWEELYKCTKSEYFELGKGEKPIKASAYIILDPEEISQKIYDEYELKPKSEEIISLLYSDYGEFIPIPVSRSEYNNLEEVDEDIFRNGGESDDYWNALMNEPSKYIYQSDKGMKFLMDLMDGGNKNAEMGMA